MTWATYVDRMRESSSAFHFFTDRPTEKGPLGRPSHRLVDNIRTDLK